jgi:TRAP-type transport system small permease protein
LNADASPTAGTRQDAWRGPIHLLAGVLAAVARVTSAALLVLLVALMAAQVAARYVFGSPIAWTEELARFVLIWLAFMSAVFVTAERRHIVVDVLSRRLSRRARLALECAASAAVVGACAMILPSGIAFARHMGGVRSPALGIPVSWWYWAAAIGFALIALHTIINLALALRQGMPGDQAPADGAS